MVNNMVQVEYWALDLEWRVELNGKLFIKRDLGGHVFTRRYLDAWSRSEGKVDPKTNKQICAIIDDAQKSKTFRTRW